MRRAYLSNVCVATAARRQGVAATLLKKAEQVALDLGRWLVQGFGGCLAIFLRGLRAICSPRMVSSFSHDV